MCVAETLDLLVLAWTNAFFQMSNPSAQAQTLPGMEALPFQADDGLYGVANELLMGTDVMDLFNSFIPDIDPIFWQASGQGNGFQ